MLEGLAAWVLNNYLGKYVEILNTDQLSVALLKGAVELENLPLRKNALQNLGLPIEIKSGFIGKIKLQIPVRAIRSAPWMIIIEQLYLVASPLSVQDWNASSEELAVQEIKLSALDKLEAQWRLENDCKGNNSTYYASSYSSWLNYGTGLITDVIENLQLKIRDVHIRYEDSVSINDGKPVAFGLTVESLSAQSCDANWMPIFSHWDTSVASFKLLEMHKLAIYWMALNELQLFSNLTLGELAIAMSPNQVSKYNPYYILAPVSAEAHIKRNRTEEPLKTTDNPRLVCDLSLDEVPLSLIDWQYDQMVKCIRGLDRITKLRSYRRYKPPCSVFEDARAWWLYAISCFYPGRQPAICRPKPTWEICLQRAKQNVQYVQIYSKILITPTAPVSIDEKQLKDTVEFERDFEEIKVLREVAMRTVPLQNRNSNNTDSAGRSMLVRWFPQWIGWYSPNSTETNIASIAETTQLEGELLQALSHTVENNTILKRDAVFGQMIFSLKSGSLNLCTQDETTNDCCPMLELQFKNLSLNIMSKPRTSSHLVELSLGAVYLKDKISTNSLFPILVGPPEQDRVSVPKMRGSSPRVSFSRVMDESPDLFYLAYEKKPESTSCDYRLCIKSKCLDVVYQPTAVKWLTNFLCLPHQKDITQSRIEAMKSRTKKELIKNWEQILDGRVMARKSWELQLDISAPQIIFVEHFNDPNSSIAVIDFGRLQLRNNPETNMNAFMSDSSKKESEDDEDMFVTPCSTPPVSEASDSLTQSLEYFGNNTLPNEGEINETSLHQKIYDRYCVELTDLQILISRVKDNWRYAHNKGTSTLHVLDRFNISLHIERRVIHTCDPLYPSLTLSANLPKLVGHINENKIAAARSLAQIICETGLPSPFNASDANRDIITEYKSEDDSFSFDTSIEMSRLLMLQFTFDHMALELQSRGRSVAELQVTGVKLSFTKRPMDISITLSVHSLLLVDALQTFGPDFELLVASHKHVGMDSMSGILRDSEPTSPISPASPDPSLVRASATSPVALNQALSTLASSPPLQPWMQHTDNKCLPYILDSEALITIEVVLITGPEPMQIANIQFNNLDIIANQETIVELMGFFRRVFPDLKPQKQTGTKLSSISPASVYESTESLSESNLVLGRTELTFDFHRLNVLLLRGVIKEGIVYGKKICTATLSETKIQATFGSIVKVEGSLGGLQVLDLTPEGHMHQRIVSVGRDPLLEAPHPLYAMTSSYSEDERKAFSFQVSRSLKTSDNEPANIVIRMASLWYTHSPQFVVELQSCATEFKQYLANLARSIRSAATDMALGLVHAKAEALAQSIYMNSRLSASLYGSTLSFSDVTSPRKRRRSSSMEASHSGYSSTKDTIPQTPFSPDDNNDFIIDLMLDIELDSPVLVLPRTSNNPQVFVAHLGKITVNNKFNKPKTNGTFYEIEPYSEHYDIEVRHMNLFSLDTSTRRVPGPVLSKPNIFYCCETLAKPVIHDIELKLSIKREILQVYSSPNTSVSNLLLDDKENPEENYNKLSSKENLYISGSVVNTLNVSLTRAEYEQVLDTLNWHMNTPVLTEQSMTTSTGRLQHMLADISEEDTGVTTLNMDPHVRAKMFVGSSLTKTNLITKHEISLKIIFELPIFTVELCGQTPTGEQGLVNLSFREFIFIYEKLHRYETNIQVSLRSILMEDLLQAEGTKQRAMVISSCDDDLPTGSSCVSRSCPDLIGHAQLSSLSRGSLPDHLEPARVFGMDFCTSHIPYKGKRTCPNTPPPSPKNRPEKNLVLISTLLIDPSAPNFNTDYNSIQRSTSVDFNSLDLVISVESWIIVIDFFTASASVNKTNTNGTVKLNDPYKIMKVNTETNISIRSLTMILVRPDQDIAKANISGIDVLVKMCGLRKEVEGRLGSMSLSDLTLHGQLYRERFVTSGKQALHFNYIRCEQSSYDAQLKLEMSSVIFVYTKRFVAEVQAFFNHFTQLQAVMQSIRVAASGQMERIEPLRLSIIIQAGSPIILLPVSSKSNDLLIVDLGNLLVTNQFKLSGEDGTISVVIDTKEKKCLLDVMLIELQNMDIYAGFRVIAENNNLAESIKLGSYVINKYGHSLLTDKCQLKLQVEHNLNKNISHNVPDMSIQGELSTLEATLDLSQYRLIRGLLSENLGEDTEKILPSVKFTDITTNLNFANIWTLSSLQFDLLNVTVSLHLYQDTSPLACINFIKSRLTIDNFSNLSQDIDLISQEILILDTRFDNLPIHERSSVFSNILQPIKLTQNNNLVQAEIHSRKRQDHAKFTILLNNMRLMAIFNWWEAIHEFILGDSVRAPVHQTSKAIHEPPKIEVKLNITDSEVVFVEDTAQQDTNAVIFKSTTVVTYHPSIIEKPLSCSLNNCEMFSCILGKEDETALSIIDPVTLSMDINKEKILEVQLHHLTVRLSYHDIRMFIQMLNSLPKQMFMIKDEKQVKGDTMNISKLTMLGFKIEDCIAALNACEHRLDDAALWLTQNAIAIHSDEVKGPQTIKAVEVKANCISLCIIDDCGDVDVPLLEISLSDLNISQKIQLKHTGENNGILECVLGSDYYNRVLSGWEPVIEPWRCLLRWNKISPNILKRSLQLSIDSEEILNFNVTSTFIELFKQVKDNWMRDFYDPSKTCSSPVSYKQRSPFVPFAIKNDTGSTLQFTTLITDMDKSFDAIEELKPDENWITVQPGNTVPFSFKSRSKLRHWDSHNTKMHQLAVKVDGWHSITPVTVDQVGIYFRHASAELQCRKREILQARIVFDVALEGSARKLVTIRSALLLANKLNKNVEVKLESQLPQDTFAVWAPTKTVQIPMETTFAVPIVHVHSLLTVRPADSQVMYTFCSPHISWSQVTQTSENLYESRTCHTYRGHNYQFCAEIRRENYPVDRAFVLAGVSNRLVQPAHTITFLPMMLLVNLLPIDLYYNLGNKNGRVPAGVNKAITFINTDEVVELGVSLENFSTPSILVVPAGCNAPFTCRIKLIDNYERTLILQAIITPNCDAKLKITVSAPFWIINKTGLPIVFRQSGVNAETAGQFSEHEVARMVTPLLFSFSDQDASPSVVARVGTHVIPDGTPQWCQNFHLKNGIQVRKLHVNQHGGKPDVVFIVGIEVRVGRGKYRLTNIVTISPRYQLHNKSSYELLFAQSYDTTNSNMSQSTYLKAMPDCHMPFHWPRLDQPQLLCVLIQDIENCCWSGGLKIDKNYSMHVNIRDINNRVYFLRLEVILQGATFFVIFTDADQMPPPIRVDNYSEVSITFAQMCCKDFIHSTARAHSSVPYAWDHPTKPQLLMITAPGGVSGSYDLNDLGFVGQLTYENFIYIAFSGTFKTFRGRDPLDMKCQELVLDVVNNNQVVLAKKRHGLRSQLWRMNAKGQLQHEGSSPPSHPNQQRFEDILVLDIEGPAPQPSMYSRLMLRRPDSRRQSTQTWRFTEEGRLCCAHYNMCVQAQDGFFGLRQGNGAVLGLPRPECIQTTENGIPLEQAISRQRLRPGSGFLAVEILMDGPTRVLRIRDLKEDHCYATSDDRDWVCISVNQRPNLTDHNEHEITSVAHELQLNINLAGLGISLIAYKPPQELLFANFSNITSEIATTHANKRFCVTVQDIQFDNQLFETPAPVFLCVTQPSSRSIEDVQMKMPALDINAEMQQILNDSAVIFKYLSIKLKKLTVTLEERLVLKLLAFFGFNSKEEELISKDESDYEMQRMLTEVSGAHARRYYFGKIQLVPDQIRLSMKTASKLPAQLLAIKRKLGLTLIKFEDAAVDLEPFIKEHPFETLQFLLNSIVKHFKDELLWQAGIILGSVDFLGNPLGLMNDVSEGFSGLIYEGSVGALVKNVTHGLSNSAAKVTESISDGLGRVIMDDEHEEMRQKIRQVESGKSKDHIYAGIKGLGFGILGGATGIFKQVYEGAANDGIQGVFSGFGKGLVGAVTKPVVGVLDLASETARAVRDSSRSSNRMMPERKRPPRCVFGPGGLLPKYSFKLSMGQQYLYLINMRKYNEQLIAYECMRSGSEDLRVIVSNKSMRIITSADNSNLATVIECHLSNLETCKAVTEKEGGETRHYIEITMHVSGTSTAMLYQDQVKRPRVRCDSVDIARNVSHQLNYAKRLYNEKLHTLAGDSVTLNNED